MVLGFDIPESGLAALCSKWKVRQLAVFGSALREDFGPEGDVDVLVIFDPAATWSGWDLMDMKHELEVLFGRPVGLVEKEALRNPWRKREILSTCRVVYMRPNDKDMARLWDMLDLAQAAYDQDNPQS